VTGPDLPPALLYARAWYSVIPSLQRFGRMLKADRSIFVRFPLLIQWAAVARCVFLLVFNLSVLQLASYADDKTRASVRTAFLYWCALLAADFFVWAAGLALLGRRVYALLDQLCAKAIAIGAFAPEEKLKTERALRAVNLITFSIMLAGPLLVASFALPATIWRDHVYVSVNLAFFLAVLTDLAGLYIALFRLGT
jgi:hypothetical protein